MAEKETNAEDSPFLTERDKIYFQKTCLKATRGVKREAEHKTGRNCMAFQVPIYFPFCTSLKEKISLRHKDTFALATTFFLILLASPDDILIFWFWGFTRCAG